MGSPVLFHCSTAIGHLVVIGLGSLPWYRQSTDGRGRMRGAGHVFAGQVGTLGREPVTIQCRIFEQILYPILR